MFSHKNLYKRSIHLIKLVKHLIIKNESHYIYWNENDVHYQIYSSNENKKQLTNDELCTVQKSFSVK